jgi:DNA-binding NarL/FixJ family response regulator
MALFELLPTSLGSGPSLAWNLFPRSPSHPVEPILTHAHESIWRAAVQAEATTALECPLDVVWRDHVCGRLRVWWESVGPDRILLVARFGSGRCDLAPDDADTLRRVLSGEQQKAIASDLGIAASTLSGRYNRALFKLDLTPTTIPLPLVLAAQASTGVARVPFARSAFFEAHGQACMVISVPRPVTSRMPNLTSAEREVAARLIEGCTRDEVAKYRSTSVNTVARQFHSIFAAERVTGRFALIRKAVQLGCFAGRPA